MWIAVAVAAIVQHFDESDARGIELVGHLDGMVVAALVDLVALERRAHENRDHELSLRPGHLRQRKHRAGARAFAPGRDDDDYRVPGDERLDFVPRFFKGLPGDERVVPRPESLGARGTNQEPLFLRDVIQGELVGIDEPRRVGAPKTLREPRVALLCDGDIPGKKGFQRPQDVAPAAAGTEEKNVHVAPASFPSTLLRTGMTTHSPSVRSGLLSARRSSRMLNTR